MTSICVEPEAIEVFSHSNKSFVERHPEISNALSSVGLSIH